MILKRSTTTRVLIIVIITTLTLSIMAFVSFYKEKQMKSSKSVEWGAEVSVASYTLYKEENFRNVVSLQKSDKINSYSTSFYLKDGTWLRSLHGGSGFWGYGSVPLGGSEFEQPLPEKIRVTYLDKIANKYYQGEHSLPTDKIYNLMTNSDKKMTDGDQWDHLNTNYRNLNLAFAPDGWVTVFVTGWPGRKEIASFQAKHIEPDLRTLEGDPVSSGDETLYLDYESYIKSKDTRKNEYLMAFKKKNVNAYQKWQSGEWTISSDWYKQIQTKYPWNLSISIDDQDWNSEYYAEFANTERFAVLDDKFDKYSKELKAVPTKIKTWANDLNTGERTEIEVHLFPIPKWSAKRFRSDAYQPYYQDPNLNRFFKHFASLYPSRSLATNNQISSSDEFATLKLDFDKDLILQKAYLQKGSQKIDLEGAYQFSKAPVDMEYSPYTAKRGYPQFLTQPKTEDLSDPAFVDLD